MQGTETDHHSNGTRPTIHGTLQQKLRDSRGEAERRRQSGMPHPGSRAGSAGRPGDQLWEETVSGLLKYPSIPSWLQSPTSSLLFTSSQEPAMVEPGTLIIGVSEEGVLHQLQLCRGQGGMVLWLGPFWAPVYPHILPSLWRTSCLQFHWAMVSFRQQPCCKLPAAQSPAGRWSTSLDVSGGPWAHGVASEVTSVNGVILQTRVIISHVKE